MTNWTHERLAQVQARCESAEKAWAAVNTDRDASNWAGEYAELIFTELRNALAEIKRLRGSGSDFAVEKHHLEARNERLRGEISAMLHVPKFLKLVEK